MHRAALGSAMLMLAASAIAAETPAPERIVFLGSSSTDGFTYPLLVRQALVEAGRPAPLLINAGAGGNLTTDLLARAERDALARKPNIVVVQSGVNDATKKIPAEDYEKTLRALVERLKKEGAAVVLLTPNGVTGKHAASNERIGAYCAVVKAVAKDLGCRVGDVNERMAKALAAGASIHEPDDLHPNFEGYRLMAQAVLEALGHENVPVPAELKIDPYPGVVARWSLKAVAEKKAPPLTEAQVAALTPDASWAELTLPETEPQTTWWLEQTRKQGFALSVAAKAGASPANRYLGVAKVAQAEAGKGYLNTGGHVQSVWLNGKQVFKAKDWTGFHAGKERVPVEWNQGENTLVIETGPQFFLSLTPMADW